MKKILTILIALLILPVLGLSTVSAKELDSKECISIDELYLNLANESESLVGEEDSYDLIKKERMASKLVIILEALAGENIVCDKDGNPSGEGSGILGFFENSNTNMMAGYSGGNTSRYLAGEIEGVNSRFSAYAQDSTASGDKPLIDLIKEALEAAGSLLVNGLQPKIEETVEDNIDIDTEYPNWCMDQACSCPVGDDGLPYTTCILQVNGEDICKCVDGYNVYVEGGATEAPNEASNGYDYLQAMGLVSWWSFTRNIAYVGFIVIMIVVGFMIMFRKKISSQAVVSINNALPQIVLALILTTFSFAIVGIMLDLGKVTMNIAGNFIERGFESELEEIGVLPVGSFSDYSDTAISTYVEHGQMQNDLLKKVLEDPFWGGILGIFIRDEAKGNVRYFYTKLTTYFSLNMLTGALLSWDISNIVAEPIDILKQVLLSAVEIVTLPELIMLIVVLLLSLYASFRLFMSILILYVKIFISTITAPLTMLMGSLPGSGSQIMNWFKGLLASILSFSVIFVVINFVRYLALSQVISIETMNFFGNTTMAWPTNIVPLEFVLLIFGYLFAANVPKLMSQMLKVGESKEMAGALQDTMKSASKIPLIGTLFK